MILKYVLHSPHSFTLEIRKDMGVSIKRYGYGRVPQKLLNDFGVHFFCEKQGGTGVSKIMKSRIQGKIRSSIRGLNLVLPHPQSIFAAVDRPLAVSSPLRHFSPYLCVCRSGTVPE